METEELLRIGQYLDCELLPGTAGDQRRPAKVVGVKPGAVLLTPAADSRPPLSIPLGAEVALHVTKGQALYFIRGRVVSGPAGELAVCPEGPARLIQKRSYVRVEDTFQVEFRTLSAQEYERRRQDFATRSSKRGEARSLLATDWSGEIQDGTGEEIMPVPESVFVKMLIGLDRKLDKVINLLEHPEGRPGFSKGTGMNISGAGISFVTQAAIDVGTGLELALELKIFPPIHLVALGKALRVREVPPFPDAHAHFEVAVEFTDIHEDDRDDVIRYTFRRQRELLRSQKIGGDPSPPSSESSVPG